MQIIRNQAVERVISKLTISASSMHNSFDLFLCVIVIARFVCGAIRVATTGNLHPKIFLFNFFT